MSVLVTGATGFVGRRLVCDLLNKSTDVRILKQGPLPIPEEWTAKTDILEGDLTQPDSLRGIAEGIHTVFHLAGEIRDSRKFDSVNRIGTDNLLKVCQTEGVRKFLCLSSVGVMGTAGKRGIVDERWPAKPGNAYEKSKYGGERVALGYHREGGLDVIVLRPSIIYGEGKAPAGDHFLSWVRSVESGYFMLLGEKFVNSYVYVGDVTAAAMMLADHPKSGGEIFIINEPILLREFINEMTSKLGRKRVRSLPPGIGQICQGTLKLSGRFGSLYNQTQYSMRKLEELGFRLPYGYREGLRRTLSWYKQFLPERGR
jgi:nucleoside-diphosphate-sugar epimerase